MINSRSLDDLLPEVKGRVEAFIRACKTAGLEILVTSTYRDNESQSALYAQGRTTPGQIVTSAKAGQSFHQFRCAADFVPIVNGKAQWNDLDLFRKCGVIAESVGLEWSGRWQGKFKESAHVQFTDGLSLSDLQAGKKIGVDHV